MLSHPGIRLDAVRGPRGFTVHNATTPSAASGRVVVEELGRDWTSPAGGPAEQTVIEWADGAVVVCSSRQNVTPVHYWVDPDRRRVCLGTDLAGLTADVLAFTGGKADDLDAVRALRPQLWQVLGDQVLRIGADGTVLRGDRTAAAWTPAGVTGETPAEAGERQLAALDGELARISGGGPVTALISGGVDSGVVAALAHRAGLLDGLATLGTVWGDERAEAEDIGRHLGHPVRYVALTADDILDALPDTVRMLGAPSAETVAIACNLVALYRRGVVPAGTLLTGYGSDLINSGLRADGGTLADLRPAVLHQLAEAAGTAEFSGVAAAAYGYRVRHPFWARAVIQAALDTDPGLMSHRGREKGHLREAATRLLPDGVAWRRKQALHRGSGVDRHLAGALAQRLGGGGPVDLARLYELIGHEVVKSLARAPERPVDGPASLDAAMVAYRSTV